MSFKAYRVYVEDVDFGHVPLDVSLKVAKALKQVDADKLRLNEHLKQVPLVWERFHSDTEVVWRGFINNVEYAKFIPAETAALQETLAVRDELEDEFGVPNGIYSSSIALAKELVNLNL